MTSLNNNTIVDRGLSRYIKLQIQYGSDLYELLLSSEDNKIRIEHVLDEIEKITKLPKCHQTIIYKGQRLDHKPKAYLDDFYIFNNSKLVLSKTQKHSHDKYCYPNRNHKNPSTSTLSNSVQSEQQDQSTRINREENSKNDLDKNPITKTQMSSVSYTKRERNLIPTGFVPEANKTYE